MVRAGNRKNGNRNNQINGAGRNERLEKSLKGKWIGLARDWLIENVPCKVAVYLNEVAPLMPTHIVNKSLRMSQINLAQSALNRLKRELVVEIQDDLITDCKPRKSGGTNVYHFEEINFENTVRLRDFATEKKKLNALGQWLKSRGYKRVSHGVYSKENQ